MFEKDLALLTQYWILYVDNLTTVILNLTEGGSRALIPALLEFKFIVPIWKYLAIYTNFWYTTHLIAYLTIEFLKFLVRYLIPKYRV